MGKSKHKKIRSPLPEEKKFMLEYKYQDMIYLGIIIILLVILLKPMVIDKLMPEGVDVNASIGQTHQVGKYFNETGERALWNPYVFGGMPLYHRLPPVTFSLDTAFRKLNNTINRTFLYYLLAALGMFLLLRYMNIPPIISLFGTLTFILFPHYKSLYLVGHYAKFKALMFLPWVFLSFKYLLDKKNILSASLFALALGLQIRTEHYQIVFYTVLILFAIGIYPVIKLLINKNYKIFIKTTVLTTTGIILAIMIAAQPLFLAKEYLPFSKRGKTTINLNDHKTIEKKSESAGVNINYATQWSTHPLELITWIIPRFYGGMSQEKYTGNKVPHLKNRIVPGYWGFAPFLQSYEYIGIIIILLAIIGIMQYGKESMLRSLWIIGILFILLSFGRHFVSFYKIFFNYVPFFNKFRAPMMSVTVIVFIISIFGTYGLYYLYKLKRESDSLQEYKNILIPIGLFFVFGIILLVIAPSFSFSKAGENYPPDSMEILRNLREDFLMSDIKRFLVLLIVTAGSIIAYLKRKISFVILSLILMFLTVFDLVNIQNRHHTTFIKRSKLTRKHFVKSPTEEYLFLDKNTYRIYPAGGLFQDTRWAYYHQTIGGYTPVKLYTIEELIHNNLQYPIDKTIPINWNVLQFLNVKYIILQQKIDHPELTLVHSDNPNQIYTYLFKDHLPRCFFVDKYKIIKDEYERLKEINSNNFNVKTTAILEEELPVELSPIDSSYSKVTHFSPNRVTFDVFTDKRGLLVISEIYYPPGWKIFIDDQQVNKIYKTDHAIQSILVPAGSHTIDLQFSPDLYKNSVTIAGFSLVFIYIVIVVALIMNNKDKLLTLRRKFISK